MISSANDHDILATLSMYLLLERIINYAAKTGKVLLNIVCDDYLYSDIVDCVPGKKCVLLRHSDVRSDLRNKYSKIPAEKKAKKNLENNSTSAAIDSVQAMAEEIIKNTEDSECIVLVNFPQQGIFSAAARFSKLAINNLLVMKPGVCKNSLANIKNYKKDFSCVFFTKKKLTGAIKAVLLKQPVVPDAQFAEKIMLCGLDVSMSGTGIACIQDFASNSLLVGTLKSKPSECDFIRGQKSKRLLSQVALRDRHSNIFIADLSECRDFIIEGGALDAVHGAYRLGRYCGMFMSAFDLESVREIAPSSLKKFITGYGRADKDAVKLFLAKKLEMSLDFIKNDNESDALALLYTALNIDEYESRLAAKKRPTKKTR